MANTRSARKRIRANERKHVRNRAVRSAVRTKVTKARRALLSPGEGVDTVEEVRAAIKALDRAAEKGILHPNNARRRKSRLASMAATLQRAGEGGEAAAARAAAAGGAKGRTTKAAGKAAAKPAAKRTTKAAAKPAAKAPAAKAARATSTAKTTRAKR